MSSGIVATLEACPPAGQWWLTLSTDTLIDVVENRRLCGLLVGGYQDQGLAWPILEPRGLPLDVTSETRRRSDEWGEAAYDWSWVTYRELDHAVHLLRAWCDSLDTVEEQQAALQNNISVPMLALLAYLKVFEDHGYRTRMVLWFTMW